MKDTANRVPRGVRQRLSACLNTAVKPLRRPLVALLYVAQPLLKPVLRATIGRNTRLWNRLQSARDELITGSTPPADLGAPLRRRLYAGVFFVLGPPTRVLLRATLGRNRGLWSRMRRVHTRILEGAPLEAWSPDTTDRASRAGATHRPFGVNLSGYLTSEKGTGEAARSAASLLKASGVPLALNNLVDTGSANVESAAQDFANVNPYAFNLVYVNGDQAANFAFHKGKPYFADRYTIGAWNWELTNFPTDWLPRFQYFDEIWVPTNFTREALEHISPIPVTTVPYAVKPPESATFGRSHFGLPDNDFIFLFMFDFHSVLERKNPFALIDAFKRAFSPGEAATLLIKSSHSDKRSVRMLREAAGESNIVITDAVLSRQEVNALYQLCDCYVSLHRSEGFGLTPAEAMAAGKPVIATAYGGSMDFMTAQNSYLVRYKLIELDRDYPPYEKGWSWADPDVDHAAELMKAVYEGHQHAAEVGRRAAADIARMLGPGAIAGIMRERLTTIAAEVGITIPETDAHGDQARSLRRREAT